MGARTKTGHGRQAMVFFFVVSSSYYTMMLRYPYNNNNKQTCSACRLHAFGEWECVCPWLVMMHTTHSTAARFRGC